MRFHGNTLSLALSATWEFIRNMCKPLHSVYFARALHFEHGQASVYCDTALHHAFMPWLLAACRHVVRKESPIICGENE
ncbi:hypothetical protein NDU88_006968 [Pleurodeles waltl]|uniref:Uncharacterized protein n=1 Tax=Pleurodeles waltl TaxID=8319 RepID=A0AAV7QLK3_PLEWA|nr:hypothetical protein NDU88_006968 [Pleurodeles waltl]